MQAAIRRRELEGDEKKPQGTSRIFYQPDYEGAGSVRTFIGPVEEGGILRDRILAKVNYDQNTSVYFYGQVYHDTGSTFRKYGVIAYPAQTAVAIELGKPLDELRFGDQIRMGEKDYKFLYGTFTPGGGGEITFGNESASQKMFGGDILEIEGVSVRFVNSTPRKDKAMLEVLGNDGKVVRRIEQAPDTMIKIDGLPMFFVRNLRGDEFCPNFAEAELVFPGEEAITLKHGNRIISDTQYGSTDYNTRAFFTDNFDTLYSTMNPKSARIFLKDDDSGMGKKMVPGDYWTLPKVCGNGRLVYDGLVENETYPFTATSLNVDFDYVDLHGQPRHYSGNAISLQLGEGGYIESHFPVRRFSEVFIDPAPVMDQNLPLRVWAFDEPAGEYLEIGHEMGLGYGDSAQVELNQLSVGELTFHIKPRQNSGFLTMMKLPIYDDPSGNVTFVKPNSIPEVRYSGIGTIGKYPPSSHELPFVTEHGDWMDAIEKYKATGRMSIKDAIAQLRVEMEKIPRVADLSQMRLVKNRPKLLENYPNPARDHTYIRYSLPYEAKVKIEVFDMQGKQVAALIDENQMAGSHQVPFITSGLASGRYIVKFGTYVPKLDNDEYIFKQDKPIIVVK